MAWSEWVTPREAVFATLAAMEVADPRAAPRVQKRFDTRDPLAEEGSMQVLVVDNDRLLLDALRLVIEARHPDLQVCVAADEARARQEAVRSLPELILLDWWLGQESSESCFNKLREDCPLARIVVMSGDDRPSLVSQVLELGASGFLRKTASDIDVMREAIDIVARGGIYLPGELSNVRGVEPSVRPKWVGRSVEECFPTLTPTQSTVLRVLLRGASNKVIARELDIAENTVKTHVGAIFGKLNVSSRSQAVSLAARLGARLDWTRDGVQ